MEHRGTKEICEDCIACPKVIDCGYATEFMAIPDRIAGSRMPALAASFGDGPHTGEKRVSRFSFDRPALTVWRSPLAALC
jgi:hypothetical protein